jgi:hypothetical protein
MIQTQRAISLQLVELLPSQLKHGNQYLRIGLAAVPMVIRPSRMTL